MKNIIEKIQDLLYDYFDYVVMLTIVIAVVAVIGWRLDVLFAKDASDIVPNKQIATEAPTDNPKEPLLEEEPTPVVNEITGEPNDEDPATESPVEEAPTEPVPDEKGVTTGEEVKVNIPAGSLPGKIASILADNGLINSSRDFIAKAVELNLDTKLKSGDFKIAKGSSYEDILRILTK